MPKIIVLDDLSEDGLKLLQSAGNIGSGIWNSNLSAPSIQGSNLFITMPATNAAQFFRLSQ